MIHTCGRVLKRYCPDAMLALAGGRLLGGAISDIVPLALALATGSISVCCPAWFVTVAVGLGASCGDGTTGGAWGLGGVLCTPDLAGDASLPAWIWKYTSNIIFTDKL